MLATNPDVRIADLERRLAAEHTKRLIAERRAAELRQAMVLLRAELWRLQPAGDALRTSPFAGPP